jgi:hypothetical protein
MEKETGRRERRKSNEFLLHRMEFRISIQILTNISVETGVPFEKNPAWPKPF